MSKAVDVRRCLTAGLALFALAGCPTKGGESADDSGGTAATPPRRDDKAEFVRKANAEAFARMLPLAQRALELADPAASLATPAVDLNIPPLSAKRRAELRSAVDAALQESDGIQGSMLPPPAEALLRATVFGLNRARDRDRRRRPWQTDPTWTTGEALDAVAAIHKAARAGDCKGCDAALVATLEETRLGLRSLSAASTFTIEGAAADIVQLRDDVARIEVSDATAQTCRDLLSASNDHIQAVAIALKSAEPATYDEPGGSAKKPGGVHRLPPALGEKALRRLLEVEENVADEPKILHRPLGPIIAKLSKLANQFEDSPSTVRPVDEARCRSSRALLVASAAAKPALPPISGDCETLLEQLPKEATDSELLLALIDRAMIDPYRAERRAAEGEVLAALGGSLAPGSQRHTYRIAIATSLGNERAIARAAHEAWDASCLAAAALWTHAEMGDEAELDAQLTARCGQRPSGEWVRVAQEHPRRALEGVAIGWLIRGPASVVPLERLWWLPLGLIEPLSNPALLRPESNPVGVHVEPVGGAPADPAASSPSPEPAVVDEPKAH